MSTEHLVFNLANDLWYDSKVGPMILPTHFGNGKSKPLEVLVDVFGLIEDAGLEVKRCVVPSGWAKFLPIEDGFLWDAWVAHDEEGPPIKAHSGRRDGQPIRTVTVDWAQK